LTFLANKVKLGDIVDKFKSLTSSSTTNLQISTNIQIIRTFVYL